MNVYAALSVDVYSGMYTPGKTKTLENTDEAHLLLLGKVATLRSLEPLVFTAMIT